MVLWHEREFSAYCAVNIEGAAMGGQNPRPLIFDETLYLSCIPIDVCLFLCLFVLFFVFSLNWYN